MPDRDEQPGLPEGKSLRLDPDASSADPELPAFLARPADAPVYHGFPIVDGADVDGFQLGMITDFLAEPGGAHDAYVIAPDGSRAGLIIEADASEDYFEETLEPEPGRWGVYGVGRSLPLGSVEDARAFLASCLPELRARWERWTSTDGT